MTVAPTIRPTMLAKATSTQLRVFADLAHRWFKERSRHDIDEGAVGRIAAVRTRGVLVVVANGFLADRVEGELLRAQLITHIQIDDQEPARA